MKSRMNRGTPLAVVVATVFVASVLVWANRSFGPQPARSPRSPYTGEELRSIKSLSSDDVEALEAGTGDALGGLAKLVELNGYPGPRHVLDSAGQLGLTAQQTGAVDRIHADMRRQATSSGRQLVERERELDTAFAQGAVSQESLERGLTESARLYGELRNAHVEAHLSTKEVLTAGQVRRYNELRGYRGVADPCRNVPPGHDAARWREHNGCLPS